MNNKYEIGSIITSTDTLNKLVESKKMVYVKKWNRVVSASFVQHLIGDATDKIIEEKQVFWAMKKGEPIMNIVADAQDAEREERKQDIAKQIDETMSNGQEKIEGEKQGWFKRFLSRF